jgi:AcrR family transcriptional regulator
VNDHSQAVVQPKSTREAILDAALACFTERGFHGTSVPVIAEAAGLAPSSLYRHFDSKEALVNELYRDLKGRLMTALAPALMGELEPRALFRRFWHRLVQLARESPEVIVFLEHHHHGDYLDEESQRLEAQTFEPFYAVLATEPAKAALAPLPPEATMAIVWGAFSGLFRAHRLGHLSWDDALLADTEDRVWRAIRREES